MEVGSNATRRTDGPAGTAAVERVKAIRDLLYGLIRRSASINVFLEIGAHKAEASKRFLRAKPGSRALAYEAAPDVFQRSVAMGLPHGMEMFNVAVGAQSGTTRFFVPEDVSKQHWSSLRKRFLNPVPTREIEVEMITLSEAGGRASGTGDARNAVLWIDVEGAALDVLRGGIDYLKTRAAAVYLEMSDGETYESGNTSLQIIELLIECGFVPVARDNQYTDAYNVLAVHSQVYLSQFDLIAKWLSRNNSSVFVETPHRVHTGD